MTKEQRIEIKKDIERLLPVVSRYNRVHCDEVESILIDDYVDEDDFTVISWPEVQELMDKEDFDTNASLANDEWTLNKYGSQAYFVNKKWLNSL